MTAIISGYPDSEPSEHARESPTHEGRLRRDANQCEARGQTCGLQPGGVTLTNRPITTSSAADRESAPPSKYRPVYRTRTRNRTGRVLRDASRRTCSPT
jgi:hypothetical protein